MSSPSRRTRLVVIPLILFVGVSATVLVLSKLHLAQPGVPKASGSVQLGDPYRGDTVFQQSCATCHGDAGKGGGIGPKLAGSHIPLATIKATIDNGNSTMSPGLVSGQQEEDVLAYLQGVVANAP